MKKKFICFILFVCTFSGCHKEQSENVVDDYRAREVDILFSPSGLGDAGYNDMSLFGVAQSQKEHGFGLKIHNPKTLQEEWECFKEWSRSEKQNKRLFIFCSNSYEDLLRETELSKDSNSTILIFETEEPIDGTVGFKIEGYGAAYYIGQIASQITYGSAVLMANPFDKNTVSIADGFSDGYKQADTSVQDVPYYYLAEEAGEGYSMEEEAYVKVAKIYQECNFIFPITGKSNLGVYRYLREYGKGVYTAGIDSNMEAYSNALICSLVKSMDCVLYEYVTNWVNDRINTLPAYKHFLFSDGYIDVVIADDYKDFFGSDLNQEILSEAIKQEMNYVEK